MCQYMMQYFYPPPVTFEDVQQVVAWINDIDREVAAIREEQSSTTEVYRFASLEFEVEKLLYDRSYFCRRKQELLHRARLQGPRIDTSEYQRLD